MANGLPDHPPAELEFGESLDDETCPVCAWEAPIHDDPLSARESGNLLAIEQAEGSPLSAMGGMIPLCHYWRCPNGHLFTTESELALGGMA